MCTLSLVPTSSLMVALNLVFVFSTCRGSPAAGAGAGAASNNAYSAASSSTDATVSSAAGAWAGLAGVCWCLSWW